MNPILQTLDAQFLEIDRRSAALLLRTPDDLLYRQPRERPEEYALLTIGENILRSAAAVEQVAGGITTRLWDDPFEWTLPEKLSTVAAVKGYLEEVETARKRAFDAIGSDEHLTRRIPSPEHLRPLFQILIDAAVRASHFQGRAYSLSQTLSGKKPPGIQPGI